MSENIDKEYDDFAIFIAKKSKNVTAPMNLEKLCSEFKRKSGTSHSEEVLMIEILDIRMQIFEWETRVTELEDFDTDTKVKVLFALSGSVDYKFLERLRRKAVVEVDKYLRITKYEKKREDGLRLSGVHSSTAPQFPNDTCKRMLKLLSEISKNRKTPIEYEDFAKEFEKSMDYKLRENKVKKCYNYIKMFLHMATEFDMPTRIKMLFVSEASVNPFFLEMIRKDAIVMVDEENRITNYKANDGSLLLNSLNTSITKSGRLSKNLYSTTDFFTDNGDNQFFRNRRKSARQQQSKNKKSNAVVYDSPTTSSNNSNIGGDVSDDDNKVKVSDKKENIKNATSTPTIPAKASLVVSISDPCSSSKKDDDIEFDAPVNEENVGETNIVKISEPAKVSKNKDGVDTGKPADLTQKIDNIPARSSAQIEGKMNTETNLAAPNTKNEKKDVESSSESGSSSKIDNKENKIVSTKKNEDAVDAKKVAKFVDSTPKIQKTSAEKPTASTLSKAENGEKANIKKAIEPVKNISTSKIDDNKGNKTVQKEKNVPKAKPDAVKITPKVENKKRKAAANSATTSAKIAKKSTSKNQENEESQEDDVIYGGGDPPLPIPLVPRKTEEMEYQEEQVDRVVAYRPTEFGNSQFLPDYPHDNDVKLEEMDHLEAIRDVSFAPVNSPLPDKNSENQRIEMTSSEDILKVLRSLVRSLDAPIVMLRETSKKNLQEFLEKIDKAMEKMRVENHKVEIDEMMTILNASLHIVMKSTPSTSSSEDSMSLQIFLCTLRSILIAFNIPALDDFQETVNENLRDIAGQDKMIPIEKIRRSLETVLALASS